MSSAAEVSLLERCLARCHAYFHPAPSATAGCKRQRRGACRAFFSEEGCKYGDTCKYRHEEGAAVEAFEKSPEELAQRYYSRYYSMQRRVDATGTHYFDSYVHIHSNRLVVVGVCASHAALQWRKLSLQASPPLASLALGLNGGPRVSGKRKKGGPKVGRASPLLSLRGEERGGVERGEEKAGEEVSVEVLCGCEGHVIEVNARLLADPTLLQRKPESEGYIAVLLAPLTSIAAVQRSLMNREEYEAACAARSAADFAAARAHGAKDDVCKDAGASEGSAAPDIVMAMPTVEAPT